MFKPVVNIVTTIIERVKVLKTSGKYMHQQL